MGDMQDTQDFAEPWQEFERAISQRPLIHGPTIPNLLKEWEQLGGILVSKLTFPAPDSSVHTRQLIIPNSNVQVRIYTPPNYQKGSNVAGLYIHGGGWAMGDLDTDDADCRALSKAVGVVLVSVEYRLAPQHPFPAGLDDCLTAFDWLLQHAETLSAVPGKVFIAGASAGGGSAFGLALRLVDAGRGKQVAGIVAQVPVTVHPDAVPAHLREKYTSYEEKQEHTVNTRSAMMAFWEAYAAPAGDKYANPLLHNNLAQLPRVYMTWCDQDTLRDDARLMRDALLDAGVDARFDEVLGYPHYFWTFPHPALSRPAEEYRANVAAGLRFVLARDAV